MDESESKLIVNNLLDQAESKLMVNTSDRPSWE